MALEFKDYYAILGLTRTATADDIKKGFRKLARKYHPDVAKDKKVAEEKFKEINEAHEVLSDPVKRRQYDELGANWQQGGSGPRPQPGGMRGTRRPSPADEQEFQFGGTGFSDFFEQFFGGGRRPGGAGEPGFGRRAARGGMPEEPEYAERGAEVEGDILVTLDEAMKGSMRKISLQHVDPRTGEAERETFTVRIPPGALEGRRIRVPGKGGPGSGGGPAGDLYLRVRLAAHPDFDVRGADLYHDLELAPWEAVLGQQVAVPTLSGAIKLKIPAGTSNGRQLRVRGQGLPNGAAGERGDLYAVVSVQVPPVVTDEERALWEQLAKVSKFDPRSIDS